MSWHVARRSDMVDSMRLALGCLVLLAASADAAPFRWQAPDGTRVEAEVMVPPGESPRLELTKPSAPPITLEGADGRDAFRVSSVRDDLIIVGASRAWRFTWKRDRFALVASASWTTPRKRPGWVRWTENATGFEAMRQLLRFEGTLPGLERFFGEATVKVSSYGGTSQTHEEIPGSALLARWERDGFPLARGWMLKNAGPRCMSLPGNYASSDDMPANDPDGPRLLGACFARDGLQVTRIDLVVTGKTK